MMLLPEFVSAGDWKKINLAGTAHTQNTMKKVLKPRFIVKTCLLMRCFICVITGALNNMKTLDEIIETAPYSGTAWTRDALYYLKEYKTVRESLLENLKRNDDLRQMYLNAMAQWEENPPLTWEQLKEMEGEPIFIVQTGINKIISGWTVVKNFGQTESGDYIITSERLFEKKYFGKTWNAYRRRYE